MYKKVILLFLIIICLLFTACADNSETAFDDETITHKGIEVGIHSYSSYGCNISLRVMNHNLKPYNFTINNATIIRESNSAEYTVSFDANALIECDIPKYFYLEASIPTLLSDDNYSLLIKTNKGTYRFHLYETPYDQRKNILIQYCVDGQIVRQETIKSGRILGQLRDYMTNDRTQYVNEWLIEDSIVDDTTIVNEDVIVNGYLQDVFSIGSSTSEQYAVIFGISYVPSEGIVVIPQEINGKEIEISSLYAYSDSDRVKELYLPLVFHVDYSLDFTELSELESIYYEGTEKQFNDILQGIKLYKNENTRIVYNTSYN